MKGVLKSIVLCSLVLCSVPAWAGIWTEIGDAGNNLPDAQIVYGSGPLTQIIGHLSAPGDTSGWVDVWAIYVQDTIAFTAVTSGGVPDPELFIFDAQGHGLEGNRDISASNKQAYLLGGSGSPGIYYLWISTQDREPGANGVAMFPATGGVGQMIYSGVSETLTGPIGNVSSVHTGGSNYEYTITLTGTSFVPVPEPGTASLLLAGFAVLAARKLKRR